LFASPASLVLASSTSAIPGSASFQRERNKQRMFQYPLFSH
jgi:hypothetical protein